MIRRATFLWGGMAVGLGIGLFVLKYEVQNQEDRLTHLNLGILNTQERMHVLNAEWAYLNDPARLRDLGERHLGLKPLGPEAVLSDLSTLAPRVPVPAVEEEQAPALAKAENAPPVPQKKPTAPAQPKPKAQPKPQAKPQPKPAPSLEVKLDKPAPVQAATSPVYAPVPSPVQAPAPEPAPANVIVIKSPALGGGTQ